MGPVIRDALLERAVSYLPFVVYDGKAGLFALCKQSGYVDATGLDLEHQHIRFINLCSTVFHERNVNAAWLTLCRSEQETIRSIYPESNPSDGCRALRSELFSMKDVHRLVALLQFVSFEGLVSVHNTLQTWRLVQFLAAALKGGSRSSQWTMDAWNRLTVHERDAWRKTFGPSVSTPKEIKTAINESWINPYLDALAICQKRRDLLTFNALILKTAGKVPETPNLPAISWSTVRALKVLVDRDKSPFPLALLALFIEDVEVVAAFRGYFAFWRGEKTASVFKQWDGKFWQGHPTSLFYMTQVLRRYARLRSNRARFVGLDYPKRGESCPCETSALYCKDCLEIKSIPNFSHPPPGRSIALDVNANRVVCQLCRSTRVIRVPLFNPENPSVTLSLSHPDRQPLHICYGSPFCYVKTSYLSCCGTC